MACVPSATNIERNDCGDLSSRLRNSESCFWKSSTSLLCSSSSSLLRVASKSLFARKYCCSSLPLPPAVGRPAAIVMIRTG
jgi:hypothetical protein